MGWTQGSVVMEARPYAHIICQKYAEERCNFCLKSFGNLKKCASCKNVRYCGVACQKTDWKIHKTECPIMRRVPNVPTDSIRLYLRLVLLHLGHSSSFKDHKAEAPCIRGFNDLMSHSENIKTDKKRTELFHIATDFLRAYTHGVLQLPNDDTLLDIFGKQTYTHQSKVNSYFRALQYGSLLGAQILTFHKFQARPLAKYPFYRWVDWGKLGPSVLDHRCRPNAVASFNGPRVVVRAVEDIPSGRLSDVYLSYVDPMATVSERHQQLQEQYYFSCDCNGCLNTDMEARMTSLEGSNKGDLDKAIACLQAIDDMRKEQGEASEMLSQCEDCLTNVKLPPYNVHLVRLRGKAFDLAIETEQWDAALKFGMANLKPYS
ncbi:histone-lysine N-methyltransferase SMYD3 [Elysia marginata]|uniref:Histone-lysine N-methyltransferase SMYD3 n=1 Tax=Elysia marginata TaxID=1093978 RepID=A0AAV4I3P1_9GAST|nr:histone-lysine N-methyltransferase SMYD3 [Elysia marginata]